MVEPDSDPDPQREPDQSPAITSPLPNVQTEQQPAQVDDPEPSAGGPIVEEAPTPALEGAPTVASPLVEAEVDVDDIERVPEPEVVDVPDGSNGAPVGLIAFGAVALALVGVIGAVALRRRLSG